MTSPMDCAYAIGCDNCEYKDECFGLREEEYERELEELERIGEAVELWK